MKKILFLTAHVPNPSAAGEKNAMVMLDDLGKEHKVDVAYFKHPQYSDYLPTLPSVNVVFSKNVTTINKLLNIICCPFVHPFFSVRFNWLCLFKIRKIIKKENYDLLIFNHSQTFLYAHFLNKNIPKILISRDVMIQRVSRTPTNKLMLKICKFSEKKCLIGKNKHVLAVSQKDCDLISQLYNVPAYPCPTCMDKNIENKRPQNIENYFVMFGDWKREDNYEGAIWFFRKVLPLFSKKVNIKIIGKNFQSQYLNEISKLHNIEYLGFVDDPYSIISNAKALISPLFSGAGVKVKVIETLACGTPIIGTAIAFEGISSEWKKYMIEVNTPEDYFLAMNNITTDVTERIALKERFIANYKFKTLPIYVNEIFQNQSKIKWNK